MIMIRRITVNICEIKKKEKENNNSISICDEWMNEYEYNSI